MNTQNQIEGNNMERQLEERKEQWLRTVLMLIKDEKLKELIKRYHKSKNPQDLLSMLEYFNVIINKDRLDAVIPYFDVLGQKVFLGALILDGNLFDIELTAYGIEIKLQIHQTNVAILYKQDEKPRGV